MGRRRLPNAVHNAVQRLVIWEICLKSSRARVQSPTSVQIDIVAGPDLHVVVPLSKKKMPSLREMRQKRAASRMFAKDLVATAVRKKRKHAVLKPPEEKVSDTAVLSKVPSMQDIVAPVPKEPQTLGDNITRVQKKQQPVGDNMAITPVQMKMPAFVDGSTMIVQAAQTRGDDSTSVQKKMQTLGNNITSVQKETQPLEKEKIPLQKDLHPVGDEITPFQKKNPLPAFSEGQTHSVQHAHLHVPSNPPRDTVSDDCLGDGESSNGIIPQMVSCLFSKLPSGYKEHAGNVKLDDMALVLDSRNLFPISKQAIAPDDTDILASGSKNTSAAGIQSSCIDDELESLGYFGVEDARMMEGITEIENLEELESSTAEKDSEALHGPHVPNTSTSRETPAVASLKFIAEETSTTVSYGTVVPIVHTPRCRRSSSKSRRKTFADSPVLITTPSVFNFDPDKEDRVAAHGRTSAKRGTKAKRRTVKRSIFDSP